MRKPAYSRVFDKCEDPDGMAKIASECWDTTKALLSATGSWTDRTAQMTDILARATADFETNYPEVVASPLVNVSENGGEFANMRRAEMRKLEGTIANLIEKLKLCPQKAAVEKPDERPQAAANSYFASAEKRPN